MDDSLKDKILLTIADNIRIERLKRKLTQDKLAEMCGITQKYLNLIEKAKVNPSILIVINICKNLEIDLNTVYDLSSLTL